jgi:hypothetical protein
MQAELGAATYVLSDDAGRFLYTKQAEDLGKFRTAPLRYTMYTAPYMHNGVLETLRDVVEFYNRGGGGNAFARTKSAKVVPLGLSDGEVTDLVRFLSCAIPRVAERRGGPHRPPGAAAFSGEARAMTAAPSDGSGLLRWIAARRRAARLLAARAFRRVDTSRVSGRPDRCGQCRQRLGNGSFCFRRAAAGHFFGQPRP